MKTKCDRNGPCDKQNQYSFHEDGEYNLTSVGCCFYCGYDLKELFLDDDFLDDLWEEEQKEIH